MATTTSDLPVPEIMLEAVSAAFEQRKALWKTSAVKASPKMPYGNKHLGKTIEIPYFNSIGEFDEVAEGTALTPVKITADAETATVRRAGKAFTTTTWAHYVNSFADPYVEAAAQIAEGVWRFFDKALIDAAVATLADYTEDVYDATTPRTIDTDLIADGRAKWGDETDDPATLMIVHSKVENDLRKLKDATGRNLLLDPVEGRMPRILGYPVGVSDRVAPAAGVTPSKYTSILLKPGALALWYNGQPRIEADRDILADADVMAIHVYFAVHRYTKLGPGSTKPGVVLLKHN